MFNRKTKNIVIATTMFIAAINSFIRPNLVMDVITLLALIFGAFLLFKKDRS